MVTRDNDPANAPRGVTCGITMSLITAVLAVAAVKLWASTIYRYPAAVLGVAGGAVLLVSTAVMGIRRYRDYHNDWGVFAWIFAVVFCLWLRCLMTVVGI